MAKKQATLRICVVVIVFLFSGRHAPAQGVTTGTREAPSGLMCDMMAYSDYQSIGGYPVQPTWDTTAFLSHQAVRIADSLPSFSWVLTDSGTDVHQTAFQILVSDNPDSLRLDRGTCWNSGVVRSSRSTALSYQGKPLAPATLYYWKIRVWDNLHRGSPFSPVAAFFTGDTLKSYATATYPLEKNDQYPVAIKKVDGLTLADFGRDAFGQLKIRLFSAASDDTVRLCLGEALNAEGHVNAHPGATIRYHRFVLPLMRGWHTYRIRIPTDARNTRAVAILMPGYIGEVTPFRYAELAGYTHPIAREDFIREAVNYPFDEEASSFVSSDSLLNAVWDLSKYTMKATSFAGTFVDGDRERTPYEADAYINQLGYYAADREYSISRHTLDFLITHANWPTEWILMTPMIAWNDYLYTGDAKAISAHYDALKLKTLTALAGTDGLITTRTGQTPRLLRSLHLTKNDSLTDIVDWPHGGYLKTGQYFGGATDGFVFEPYNTVVNAFYYKSLVTMAAIAGATGHKGDAEEFSRKARRVKLAFQRKFWDRAHKRYVDGIGTDHASLHANMFALAFDLVPVRYRSDVLDFVRSRGMQCSVYGAQFLLEAVYGQGAGGYGLSLLTSRGLRSWYNMLASGSTMTMEAWDESLKSNLDLNHAWGAAPANIIPHYLAGVRPQEPGWSTFLIQPQPGDLTEMRARVPTIRGEVRISYQRHGRGYTLEVTIPGNTTAQVSLPRLPGRLHRVTLDKHGIRVHKVMESLYAGKLGSGTHRFEVSY